MIVGTRMYDGTIAQFDISTNDYKVAQNEVAQEMNKLGEFHNKTPLLVVIPGMKGRVIAHRSDTKA